MERNERREGGRKSGVRRKEGGQSECGPVGQPSTPQIGLSDGLYDGDSAQVARGRNKELGPAVAVAGTAQEIERRRVIGR